MDPAFRLESSAPRPFRASGWRPAAESDTEPTPSRRANGPEREAMALGGLEHAHEGVGKEHRLIPRLFTIIPKSVVDFFHLRSPVR